MQCLKCGKAWQSCRCLMVWHCNHCGRSGTRYSIEAHSRDCIHQPQLAYGSQPTEV